MKHSTKYLIFLSRKYGKNGSRVTSHLKFYGKIKEIEGAITFSEDNRDQEALEKQLDKVYNEAIKNS